MRELRPDQDQVIDAIRDSMREGHRHIMVQAPTGFGKTVVLSKIISNALDRKRKALTVVPAIELVDQTVDSLKAQGVLDVGVMQATHEKTDWRQPIQVASVQTLMRRQMPEADFAIVDEAHRWFNFYGKWFMSEGWRDKLIIGLSATPWTKGLGAYYSDLIVASTTEECIERGLLSPFRAFGPAGPDLTGVRTTAGDYNEGDLAERVNTAPLVADIVKTWLEKGDNQPTLCFAVDRAHAKRLQQQFESSGVTSAYVDHYTKREERIEIKRKFHNGEVKVVCNVGVLTTGVDWDVRCIIFARPTKSKMLFVQMAGRGLRNALGKSHCIFLDHSDNHARLGFVTDIHQDHLDDGRTKEKTKEKPMLLPKPCPQCNFMKPPKTAKCPSCGFVAQVVSKIETEEGELQELQRRGRMTPAARFPNKPETLGMLEHYRRTKGYAPGWKSYKFKEIYGSWPDDSVERAAVVAEPSYELHRWIKHQQIRYAKGKARGNVNEQSAAS